MQIAPNDSVTLLIDKSEMGQGTSTALVMILADELDLDWKKVKSEFAPAAPQYFNPIFGLPGTGGSCSVVCNAIFAATGKPVRRLPIRAEDLA